MGSYSEQYHGAGDGKQTVCMTCSGNGFVDDPKLCVADLGQGEGAYDFHVPATCTTCSGSGWNPF